MATIAKPEEMKPVFVSVTESAVGSVQFFFSEEDDPNATALGTWEFIGPTTIGDKTLYLWKRTA